MCQLHKTSRLVSLLHAYTWLTFLREAFFAFYQYIYKLHEQRKQSTFVIFHFTILSSFTL